MEFQPRPVRRLRQQVEEQIREAIFTGSLGKGKKLPSEAQLAEQFSVSRSTVREALRSLAALGLIEMSPGANGGIFVRLVDAETFAHSISESMEVFLALGNASLEDVTSVRGLLEIPCCRLAAEHRTEGDLNRLRDVIDRQKAASIDDPEVPEMDVEFHSTIAMATDNRILHALVFALHRVTTPVAQRPLTEEAGRTTVRQHVQIFRAIEAKDPDAAEEAIRSHLHFLESLSEQLS